MAEEKQGFEQLSQDDLNNVKAGIPPYESPVIVDLMNPEGGVICQAGNYCYYGPKTCNYGDIFYCGQGIIKP